MAKRLVAADASPLIGLAAAGAFQLPRRLFGTVTVTAAVRDEVLARIIHERLQPSRGSFPPDTSSDLLCDAPGIAVVGLPRPDEKSPAGTRSTSVPRHRDEKDRSSRNQMRVFRLGVRELSGLAGGDLPGARELAAAIQAGWIKVARTPSGTEIFPELDAGEASTLVLALKHRGERLVLMDEPLGRAQARALDIAVTGLAGVLLAAKRARLIRSVRPFFEQLAQSDFRISSEIVRAVLEEAGET